MKPRVVDRKSLSRTHVIALSTFMRYSISPLPAPRSPLPAPKTNNVLHITKKVLYLGYGKSINTAVAD
jgi:hypothetical protein